MFACDTAIYVGDDETDEDAFASAAADRLLSIRVGTRRASLARYRLRTQKDVDTLLKTLLVFAAARSRPAQARPRVLALVVCSDNKRLRVAEDPQAKVAKGEWPLKTQADPA